MATIWAWRTGAGIWSINDPGKTGWSHQVEFSDLSDLIRKLNALRPSIKGQVAKLGIVAHGDEPGVVEIGPKLTSRTAGPAGIDLRQLNDFLGSYARLIFFSCIAGSGEQGTTFLNPVLRRSRTRITKQHKNFGACSPAIVPQPFPRVNAHQNPKQFRGAERDRTVGLLSAISG